MARRPRHKNKHVEAALKYAETRGWKVEYRGSGHVWSRMTCPHGHSEHQMTIYSTPAIPEHHASRIRAFADRCGKE
jgi:hypothetical protein